MHFLEVLSAFESELENEQSKWEMVSMPKCKDWVLFSPHGWAVRGAWQQLWSSAWIFGHSAN